MSFEEEEEEKEEIQTFYLFWENFNSLDIYQIARSYVINEYYSLDSNVLLALIKDKRVKVTETLEAISYIHYGYLSVIIPTNSNKGVEND
jgi:hypothetical protein